MAAKKKDKYDKLRYEIVKDMQSRNTYKAIDEHLIDNYIRLYRVVDNILDSIEASSVIVEGARSGEDVVNPALVRLPSVESALLSAAKTLGIGPYSRKLTTGTESTTKKPNTVVSQLRPFNHTKAN